MHEDGLQAIWQYASAPAVHVVPAAPAPRVEPNAAARRWAEVHAVDEAAWQTFAAPWLEPGHPDSAGVALGALCSVRCQRVWLAGGAVLLWLDPGESVPGQHARLVAEELGVAFWSHDVEAGTVLWDAQMYRIHRRRPDRGPPGPTGWIEEHVHPADVGWVTELHRRANAEWRPVVDATFRVPDAGEGERWVQSWTRRTVRDGRRSAFGMHLDVTERERSRALMLRERERTRFALEAAGVGVWERALDGSITFWNEDMYRLRGLAPDDPRPLGELAAACTVPEDHQRMLGAVQRHVHEGEPYLHEFRVRRPDGQLRWLLTQGCALRDAEGRIVCVTGVNHDVTERKDSEALRLEKARVEAESRQKSAFMARLSHELRTPMNAVLGFAQLMRTDALEPPSARQQVRLQRIAEAGERMMVLVNDLLQLAALEPAALPAAGPPAGAGEPPFTVLCVEDHPVNLMLVRELLATRPGVRLHEATDGRSGMAAARVHRPDLVLLDLQLPDVHGLEVLRTLRAEPALAHCRFVALTANAMPDQVDEALAAGFDDYWTKPIDFGRFLAGIDRLVAATQGASRSRTQTEPSSR